MNRNLKRLLPWLLPPLIVIVWEVATRAMGHAYFPSPSTIVVKMRELWFTGTASTLWLNDDALEHIPSSLGRLLLGWVVAAVVGIALGLALGRSPVLFRFVDPIIQFGRALPPPALLPLFLALFSTGPRMQIITIAFGIVWPVLFNACDGARYVDPLQLETAKVFAMSRAARVRRIILPAAMPKIFAGLRLSLSLALILMVISELIGSTDGIGYQLRDSQRAFDIPGVWASIALLGILGFTLNWLFMLVERRALAWHRFSQRTA
ncbi:ABC transporter permease [Nonomuraea sp. NPDC059194]|uniref:ABC transporter permease n=1 Tax=Nonomuraea sp. NPDC059194 TaxID=3346764 RepID=UPI003693C9C2